MRTVGAAALALCLLAVQQPATAQTCGPDKLGVARTAVVNASGGPHFGSRYRNSGKLLADKEVVLTFDDGPSPANTRTVLKALAAQCAKATFFMVGRMALTHPAMVKEVAQRGHTVATHTWSHANLQRLPDASVEAEIELGLSSVQLALGKPVAPFFRFPYLRHTDFSLDHLRKRQIAIFDIDVDSRDFEVRNAAALRTRVIQALTARGRGIVLFHDIHASTARALPRILAELKARGFKLVHVKPKGGAETVTAYDAQARQRAEGNRVAAHTPLGERAVVPPPAAPAPSRAPAVPAVQDDKDDNWMTELWRQGF